MHMYIVKLEGEFIRGPDKFLSDFNKICRDSYEENTVLVCYLLQSFFAKLSGNPNPQWAEGELNFYHALKSTGNSKK